MDTPDPTSRPSDPSRPHGQDQPTQTNPQPAQQLSERLHTTRLSSGRDLLRVIIGDSPKVHLVPGVPLGLGRPAELIRGTRLWEDHLTCHDDDLRASHQDYAVTDLHAPAWLEHTLCRSRWHAMTGDRFERALLARVARARTRTDPRALMCGLCWPTARGADPDARAERSAVRVLCVPTDDGPPVIRRPDRDTA